MRVELAPTGKESQPTDVHGGEMRALEGGWAPERVVILEFPDMARAVAWWECEEYAEARAMRQLAGDTRMVVVEGLPPDS